MSTATDALLAAGPVIPVLVIDRLDDAVPLARALRDGGIGVLEITLRTPVALEAIRAIRADVDGVLVGAGTVTDAGEFAAVEAAGGEFVISPGATEALLNTGRESPLPYLPAISTVSELMACREFGFEAFKFFPAAASGGLAALKAFAGPFPQVRFCPTGGIGPDTFTDYLALSNVACVGGSWLAPKELVAAGDWDGIRALAASTLARARGG
jgi:2-dehydro-3-deoxyphosphogluconate aldolase/(4S)-4-hydroxy-2-oxoglutarate aldolase